ncbi:chemotaxis protein CheY [Vibrio caribbeanicus]|uniref:Chemotaxis protein CheY n=1 Tax=Vibrio caribbeanicus TaxID=701175 RepID=A0ACC4NZ92_9VIBR|nr:hybrid sensor histidine kinase/response regulator [Vibrio caribbeanicus]KHD25691.1 chemotaxis protein CheY [Vibrio caribbeanicus]
MDAFRVAIQDTVNKIYQYAEPNLTLVGWMGLLGFPTYYYVWSYLFPQPYESLALRTFCSLLFAVIAFRNYLPEHYRRYMPYYYLVAITLCLPFFFFYMMLKNDWSTIWAMSFMSSIFLHILLVHQTRIVLAQAGVSIFIAIVLVYGADMNQALNDVVWPYIPIFLFTYVFGNLFYFRNQAEHESKVSIAKSFGAGIAHEMRNPLSALKASIEVLSSILPGDKSGSQSGISISTHELSMAREVLDDADEVIRNGNEAIDLLLTSIDENRVSTSTFRKHSIVTVTRHALESFPYKSGHDKSAVELVVEQDFDFFGSDTLIKYALYNLLKNAFYYQADNDFKIVITLTRRDDKNQMIFHDNGVGIAPDVIEHIFKDFYTFGKTGSYGLGLPFCHKVMVALGGMIECDSILDEWTQFTLTFPEYKSNAVGSIKLDLMKSKSILLIGEQGTFSNILNEHAFYQGFRFVTLDLEEASKKQEYEFEFDVIFIDFDIALKTPSLMNELEAKLHFTEGRIAPLFQSDHSYHDNIERHLAIYPVEKERLKQDPDSVLDQLLFEQLEPSRSVIPKKRVCHGKTIVIADDNQSLRAYTSILLEQQGFEVIQAQNGHEVIEKLQQSPVDLVIMDIEMPSLNGLEAANAIRNSASEYANVPILGHTGDSTALAIDKIQQAGMNDYVIKPAGTDVLLDKIANWI